MRGYLRALVGWMAWAGVMMLVTVVGVADGTAWWALLGAMTTVLSWMFAHAAYRRALAMYTDLYNWAAAS